MTQLQSKPDHATEGLKLVKRQGKYTIYTNDVSADLQSTCNALSALPLDSIFTPFPSTHPDHIIPLAASLSSNAVLTLHPKLTFDTIKKYLHALPSDCTVFFGSGWTDAFYQSIALTIPNGLSLHINKSIPHSGALNLTRNISPGVHIKLIDIPLHAQIELITLMPHGTYITPSIKGDPDDIKQALSHLPPHVIYYAHATLPSDIILYSAETLPKGGVFTNDWRLDHTTAVQAAAKLSFDRGLRIDPRTPQQIAIGMASALNPGRFLKISKCMTPDDAAFCISSLSADTHLILADPTQYNQHDLVRLINCIPPGVIFRFPSQAPASLVPLIAQAIPPGVICRVNMPTPPTACAALAQSLSPGAILRPNRKLSSDSLIALTQHIAPKVLFRPYGNFSQEQIQSTLAALPSGALLSPSASYSYRDLITMITSASRGVFVLLPPKLHPRFMLSLMNSFSHKARFLVGDWMPKSIHRWLYQKIAHACRPSVIFIRSTLCPELSYAFNSRQTCVSIGTDSIPSHRRPIKKRTRVYTTPHEQTALEKHFKVPKCS